MMLVCLLCQVHAVPVGEAARVTPDLGRAVALHAGVVPAGAAAARGKRITNTCPATKSDRSIICFQKNSNQMAYN